MSVRYNQLAFSHAQHSGNIIENLHDRVKKEAVTSSHESFVNYNFRKIWIFGTPSACTNGALMCNLVWLKMAYLATNEWA